MTAHAFDGAAFVAWGNAHGLVGARTYAQDIARLYRLGITSPDEVDERLGEWSQRHRARCKTLLRRAQEFGQERRSESEPDTAGFVAWLESRGYAPSTCHDRAKHVRTCYSSGVTHPDDVNEVFLHRSTSRQYRAWLRSALRLYAEFEEATV